MATLADSFLADLEELSEGEEEDQQQNDDLEAMDAEGDAVEGADLDADIENLHHDDLHAVAKLQSTERFKTTIAKVREAMAVGEPERKASAIGLAEEDPEYQLIVHCNSLTVDIDNEVVVIHNFIRDKYRLKFPELDSLVLHPIDYARVVKRIGNEMDLTLVDLEGLLPSATIMVVSVTASTTTGKPLSAADLEKTLEACDMALALDEAKQLLLAFVESRMALVLGAKRKTLAGFSTATALPHTGFVFQCDIVQNTPPALRMRACRLLGGKCTLLARVDATGGDVTGGVGRQMREDMRKKIEKWQEPPPPKQPKPLPVPDADPKKKRGGRRLRKMKERYAMTDMRKLTNRMMFNQTEETVLGDGIGKGLGILGQAGSGKLRIGVTQSKLAAKAAKKLQQKTYGSGGMTSGLSSSLAFTPVQGFELENPNARKEQSGTASTYFSETGSFSRLRTPK
eukprot:jgi/Chlat1/4255/Chrsp27S04252